MANFHSSDTDEKAVDEETEDIPVEKVIWKLYSSVPFCKL